MGFALTALEEKWGRCSITSPTERKWKRIEQFYREGSISRFDLAVAEQIGQIEEIDEEGAAFITFLSKCHRLGHTAVKVEGEKIFPDPLSILSFEEEREGRSEREEELLLFLSMIKKGACSPIHSLYRECRGELSLLTFLKTAEMEKELLVQYKRIKEAAPLISFSSQEVEAAVEREGKKLLPEQGEGIEQALSSSFTLITGGPGTGKTYLAGKMIEIALNLSSSDQKLSLAVTAPTGKAASQLQISLSRSIGGEQIAIQAETLHSLLGMGRDGKIYQQQTYLPYNFILVDESSMVDLSLMVALFKRVKSGTRLILMGDVDQLPSVEGGAVFRDLLQINLEEKGVSVIRLSRCLRAEGPSIIALAKAINERKLDQVVKLIELLPPNTDLSQFTEKFRVEAEEGALKQLSKFRILSPFRSGEMGVKRVNQFYLKELIKGKGLKGRETSKQLYVPIMIVRNDSQLHLFNGDLGILVTQQGGGESSLSQLSIRRGDYAIFPDEGGGVRRFSALLLPPYELAFCLSIHKSQGSEFDHVVVLLPEGAEIFGSESLYTAVTRARREVDLIGSEETLRRSVLAKLKRVTLS